MPRQAALPRPCKPPKALDLATQQNKRALAESIQAKIRLYEAGTPFRESQVFDGEDFRSTLTCDKYHPLRLVDVSACVL